MAKHRTFNAEDGLVAKDLVRFGLDHIAAGFKLFSSHPFFFDSAGYLVHIGYECLLKGWVMELHQEYEGRHSIEFFRSSIPQLDVTILSNEFNETIRLIDSYEQLRYPSRNDPREV